MTQKTNTQALKQLPNETPVLLPLDQLDANPYQPPGRMEAPVEEITRLGIDILNNGQDYAIIVRAVQGRYQVADGWQRVNAFRWLCQDKSRPGFTEIKAVVRELSDRQMLDMIPSSNMHKPLTAIDLAHYYKRYLEEFKVTQVELAALRNVSQGEIANTIRLLDLPADIQDKVISQEISPTHARTLLQLGDQLTNAKVVNKLVTRVIENNVSVAALDREIKQQQWQNTLTLGGPNVSPYINDLPLFSTDACEKCEHRQLLKQPYSSAEDKLPRCANPKCWKEKQAEALQEQNRELLDRLAKKGIDKLVTMDYLKMNFIGTNDCPECPKRAGVESGASKAGVESGASKDVRIVCTDKSCRQGKEKTKREADRRAQQIEEEKAAQHVEQVFAALTPDSEGVLQAIVECLIAADDTEDDAVVTFIRAFGLFEVKLDEYDTPEGDVSAGRIMAAVREKADKSMLLRMIARLAFEISAQFADKQETKHLLDAFKAGGQQVKGTKVKGKTAVAELPDAGTDPLSTFIIHSATEGKAKHKIEYLGETFEDANLLKCIQLAFGGRPVEKIHAEIEACPDSGNKKLLLDLIQAWGGVNETR